MAPISKDSLDLEVKHKSDGSWHPCRVSLRSVNAKTGIVVNFENSKEEDIIYDKEEALTRLRFRSTPLQNGECSLIKEGVSVLALDKDQSKSTYFDAVIKKPHRVKHSNRASCRCNFEIKWKKSGLRRETVNIPSKSILKTSGEEIVSDTIFKTFISAMDSSADDDANVEVDIDGMLDKQIEQISESVNSDAKKFKDKKAMSGSKSTPRRTSRSQNKPQSDGKDKRVPEEDKTILSPLAARAALASLVHEQELPVKERSLSSPKPEKSASDDRKVRSPASNKETKSPPSRTARSSKSKEVDVEEDKILSSPRSARATRSSANKDDEKSGGSLRGKLASPEKLASPKTRANHSSVTNDSPDEVKVTSPSARSPRLRNKDSEGTTPNKKMRSSPIGGKKEESEEASSSKKKKSVQGREILSPKPKPRSSPRLKPSPRT